MLYHPVPFHRVSWQESFALVIYHIHDSHRSFINVVNQTQVRLSFELKETLRERKAFEIDHQILIVPFLTYFTLGGGRLFSTYQNGKMSLVSLLNCPNIGWRDTSL